MIVKQRLQYLSDSAKDLLEQMLDDNICFRTELDEILFHPWFDNFNADGIQNMVHEELYNRFISLEKSS